MIDLQPTKTGNIIYENKRSRGKFTSKDEGWTFLFDENQADSSSSDRKKVYVGRFFPPGAVNFRDACALVFMGGREKDFGVECANLARMAAAGVGPSLLAIDMTDVHDDFLRPTIFEVYVGERLSQLIKDGGMDGDGRVILHEAGTLERDLENKKILVDVYSQVINAHDHGLYHRDLACDNVCVRRFGEHPEDVKATIIDFELGADGGGSPKAKKPLYFALFSKIPVELMGFTQDANPSPLELDMGYLAALKYQIETDKLISDYYDYGDRDDARALPVLREFVDYLNENVDYFGYSHSIEGPFARRLRRVRDIDPLAEKLNLIAVEEGNFASEALHLEARRICRPYLDREDVGMVNDSITGKLDLVIDELVRNKFESYKELRRAQGKVVEYERVEDQPIALQASNYAQAADIPRKVHALGYDIVPLDECSEEDRVTGFTVEEVELLARMEHERWNEERFAAGWTLGERSHENKTSPYLVDYDELEDKVKEYDRDPARQIIPLLEGVGMAVKRRS